MSKLQDQVHNYAIKYHKAKRSQSMISSVLSSVPGIGLQLQNKILQQFPTWQLLQNAKKTELSSLVKSKLILEKLWKELHSFE